MHIHSEHNISGLCQDSFINTTINCLDQLHSVHAESDTTPQRLKSNCSCTLQSGLAVLTAACQVMRRSLELVASLNKPIVGFDSIHKVTSKAQRLLAQKLAACILQNKL